MNDRHSRREFMGFAAASAAGLAFGDTRSVLAALLPPEPDLIVFNAKVYTMDAAMPRAQAFATNGGRIVAVGTTAAMRALAGRRTQLFDAKQMTIVPGFIDTHNHAGGTTLLYEVLVGNPF